MRVMRFDDAVASLYQVPIDRFVAERKRLAGELKAVGDKEGAARLAKLARPPISAWVVDQLWWQARDEFDALFETAQRLRDGKLDAMGAHRDAIARLRAEATKILTAADHTVNEPTLRRVTQTLSALAAAGGWDPDPPGALSADREPPGFEAIGVSNEPVALSADAGGGKPAARPKADHGTGHDDLARARRDAAEAQRRRERDAATARAEAAADLRRAEAERAKAAAERHRIEAALRTAQGDVTQREREVVKLERDLALARSMVTQAKAVVQGLEERLAQLHN
jgi:hypothetical protein